MVEFRGRRVGDERLAAYLKTHRPRSIALYNTAISDKGLKPLLESPRLEEILIYGGNIGNAGFATLCRIPRIQSLFLHNCPGVADAGVKHLKHAADLRELSLNGTQITNLAMSVIGKSQNIWSLSVKDTKINDDGLKMLHSMPRLGILVVDRCPVIGVGLCGLRVENSLDLYMKESKASDESLKELCSSELPIRRLDVSETSITDIGLKHLARNPQLEMLRASNTQITDEGILEFASHPAIEELEILNTKVTKAGVSALKRKKRRLMIYGPE